MATIALKDLEQTFTVAEWFAKNAVNSKVSGFFLNGPLGSGKTTFAHSFVGKMQNAEYCEICSPSFTIYNYYPSIPPVIHCDLYRCQSSIPEDMLDLLDTPGIILIAEWGKHFLPKYRPQESLDFFFNMEKNVRSVNIVGNGNYAQKMMNKLMRELKGVLNFIF